MHVPMYIDSELQRKQLGLSEETTSLAGIGCLYSLIPPSMSITMIVDGLRKDSDAARAPPPLIVVVVLVVVVVGE